MKIAIINDVHIGQPLQRNQIVRAASHLAKEALCPLIDQIIEQHQPGMLINLGDLIRSENKELDRKRYQEAILDFKRASCPVLHLVGNHELKHMFVEDIENIWEQSGFAQKNYGIKELQGISLIWLGLEYQPTRPFKHKLPEEQLAWLADTFQKIDQPVLLFSHCALDDQDVEGNFFYEGYEVKNSNGFFLENYLELQKIIANCKWVEIVVQAHLHHFHVKMIHRVPYVTCPSMIDNICAPTILEHVPEIYSLLTIGKEVLTLTAFSRAYRFAGTEFTRSLKEV